MADIELTVGMACHNDWHGVYFTVQALRMYHADVMPLCELIVVDNDPGGRQGGWTANLVRDWTASRHPDPLWPEPAAVRYIGAPEVEGTAAPRDRVFREAAGRAVLCIDCHVLLFPGALRALIDCYRADPSSRDLVSGPIVMDDLHSHGTHFDDVWRGEMWGTWARAWTCPCGWHMCPREVPGDPPGMVCVPLVSGGARASCPSCGRHVPQVGWWGHERPLAAAGFAPLGADPAGAAFPIPAMGLGAFSCRRDAWLGFNPLFRGFGGEEFYIHEKFRRAGARCVCLPALRWLHRFTRAGQTVPYQLNRWSKLRNYVIGHRELGLPLDRLHEEFVVRGGFPEDQWAQALAGAEWPRGHPVQAPFVHARAMERSNAG